VAESTRYVAEFLAAKDAEGPAAATTTRFLRAEQSLALGHPLHPTPKSRQPMTPDEVRRYAPELGAAFRLHWFRADRSIVAEDSTLPATAAETLARLLADDDLVDPAVRRDAAAAGRHALIPVHPWQARRLLEQPAVRDLLDAGLLHDLGEQGRPWSATSSVRTVYRPDAPFMLKLSLRVRITQLGPGQPGQGAGPRGGGPAAAGRRARG
jgi:siderophore synthetase component